MNDNKKESRALAKVTDYGRFEVRFQACPDGTVLYATIENGRTTFSGKLKSWADAAAAWDNLVSKGYAPVREDL